MSILLGTYGKSNTPFYMYTHRSNMYLSLKDINFIFFRHQLDMKQIDCSCKDFIKETSTGDILLLTHKIIKIARSFHCYSLAELCKLSMDEIAGKVAQPLLNIIDCDQWKPISNKFSIVERDLQFESLYGDAWSLITPPVAFPQNTQLPTIELPISCHQSPIYKWLSFNLYENYNNRPEIVEHLLLTAKINKEQQAIIETRQRKTAFHLSQRHQTKHKATRKRQNNLARNRSKLPPSPLQEKRSHEYVMNNTKRLKQSVQSFDNLTLLATQATQLRGLLSSQENTHQQNRLPSLQTLLSNLNNRHT